MLNQDEMKVLEKGMMTLWIIWGAIFISLFIYIFISHTLGEEIRKGGSEGIDLPLFRNILMAVGIFEIFAIYILRKFMLPKGPDISAADAQGGSSVFDPAGAVALYTRATIITLALAEGIGIYGLVLFFLGDSFEVLYLFMAVSAALMIYYRPKRDELEAVLVKKGLITQRR
ncbi:hypothetical protein ACFL2O_06395 [Thermodesulfobacteriota bacterium]